MIAKISPEKQCLGWMLAMATISAGCSFFNQSVPALPWNNDNPSIKAAALFGSVWGAAIHGLNSLSDEARLTGARRVEILYASALVPSYLLYPPEKSLYQILSPFVPVALVGIAYRVLWANRNGHQIA